MEYGIVLYGYSKKDQRKRYRLRTCGRQPGQAKRIYPFRILAVCLMIGILIELIAIVQLPDYTEELREARQEFLLAEAENQRLLAEIEKATGRSTVEKSARDQGYTYFGETIYIPIIEDGH